MLKLRPRLPGTAPPLNRCGNPGSRGLYQAIRVAILAGKTTQACRAQIHVGWVPWLVPQRILTVLSSLHVRGLNYIRRTSETPTTAISLKSIAIRLQFVLQYASNLYCSAFSGKGIIQYASHLHRSTPPICIAIRLPFVSQQASHLYRKALGKSLVGVVTRMLPKIGRDQPQFSRKKQDRAWDSLDLLQGLSGPLNRLIGSAIGRPCLALSRIHTQLGVLNRLIHNHLGSSIARLWGFSV